jgi:hypothetical protein
MNNLRPLTIIAFFLLLAFFIADRSGLITEVNNMVHEKNGWEKTDGGYVQTEIETMHIISVSLLKDPDSNTFNVYRGAMKKSAVDRMELMTVASIELVAEDLDMLPGKIIEQAEAFECNVAIVNGEMILHRSKALAFSM